MGLAEKKKGFYKICQVISLNTMETSTVRNDGNFY